jgi:putative transposase
MPWRENSVMDERIGFIKDCNSGLWSMTELCERYEISRKSGYKWLERHRDFGWRGGADGPAACAA